MGPTMSESRLTDTSDRLNQFCLIGRALICITYTIQVTRDHKSAIPPLFSQSPIPPANWQELLLLDSPS